MFLRNKTSWLQLRGTTRGRHNQRPWASWSSTDQTKKPSDWIRWRVVGHVCQKTRTRIQEIQTKLWENKCENSMRQHSKFEIEEVFKWRSLLTVERSVWWKQEKTKNETKSWWILVHIWWRPKISSWTKSRVPVERTKDTRFWCQEASSIWKVHFQKFWPEPYMLFTN